MNRNTPPGGTSKAKLNQAHDRLLASLDSVIDVEAGLREILLQADNEIVTQSLSSVIDVEAGLREILPATRVELRQNPEAVAPQSANGVDKIKAEISPAARMMLRANPSFTKLIAGQHQMEVAEENCRGLSDTVQRLHDALFGGRSMKLAVAVDCSVVFISTAENMLITLREIAEMVPRVFDETEEQLEEMVKFGRELGLAIDRASNINREQQRVRRDSSSRGRQTARELTRDLARAQKEVEYRARGLDRIVPTYAMMLAETKFRHFVKNEAQNFLHAPRFPVLTFSEWREFLDDFTAADLRSALLVGVDLAGVRWTLRHTLWPQEIDVEDLLMRSLEIPEGSGVFVVRSGTARTRKFASAT
ncbi:hypothetical protein ACF08B_39040 [Streptomyces sp. NPDC015139]|uniref:hypothetical protein n=1 Tax=Streptomyces sp. NPDC015139 TaxID=3364942 RepID=UPI0036FED99B